MMSFSDAFLWARNRFPRTAFRLGRLAGREEGGLVPCFPMSCVVKSWIEGAGSSQHADRLRNKVYSVFWLWRRFVVPVSRGEGGYKPSSDLVVDW